jgi:hypothetical protein
MMPASRDIDRIQPSAGGRTRKASAFVTARDAHAPSPSGFARWPLLEPPIARKTAALNLPLAARPCVGHIRLTGDVAEWLKAAVC